MSKRFAAIGVAAALFRLSLGIAEGHEMYGGVYEFNAEASPSRQLCCGGDPDTGDCEALGFDQIEALPEGVRIISHRYKGAVIFVPNERISWGIPMDMRRTPPEPAMENDPAFGHWCGKPRSAMYSIGATAVTPTQQDPNYWTFCAFVKTGGM